MRSHREPPPEGWLQLIMPPFVSTSSALMGAPIVIAICDIASTAGVAVSGALLLALYVACGTWAWRISRRLAAWRRLVKLQAAAAGNATEIATDYEKSMTIQLFVLELALMAAPWVVCPSALYLAS